MLIRAKVDRGYGQQSEDPLSTVRFVIARDYGYNSKNDTEMLLKRLSIYQSMY